jgi:hypothetical protein
VVVVVVVACHIQVGFETAGLDWSPDNGSRPQKRQRRKTKDEDKRTKSKLKNDFTCTTNQGGDKTKTRLIEGLTKEETKMTPPPTHTHHLD